MRIKLYLFILVFFVLGHLKAQINLTLSGETNTVCNGFGCAYNGPSILINEVMIRPFNGDGSIYGSNNSQRGEWIELYNPDVCKAVDISCYFLGNCSPDAGGFYGGGYELPANTIVPPRGFVIVRGTNAPIVPANLLVQNGGKTVECIITDNASVCVGGGERLWFPNAGGWYAFWDRNGVPQDAISWNGPDPEALDGHPCNPPGNCPFTGTLDNYTDIPAARKHMIYATQPTQGQTIRRIPDGGNWVINTTAASTYGNCNAACAPEPIVTCVGQASVQVNGGTPPYYYLWNDPLSQVTPIAVGLCGGDYCVTVTDNAGETATACIHVDDFKPDVQIVTGDEDVCIYEPPFTLVGGAPQGGFYQGPGVVNGVFNPVTAGIGNHKIKYTYYGVDSCSNTDSILIRVHPAPVALFPTLADICVNAEPLQLNTATPLGGIYSGTGVVGSNFDPSIPGVGTFPITYIYSDSFACVDTVVSNINIIDAPDVLFASIPQICVDHAPIPLNQGSPLGGTYTGIGISGATFDPSVAGVGIHTITYKYIATTGCSDSATQTIQVLPLPVVSAPILSNVCVSGAPITLSGGTPVGGTYSGSVVTGGIFDPALAGPGIHNVFYTYTDINGCTNSDTSQQTVFALPIVSQSAFSPFCINVPSVTLTGGIPAGGTYAGPGVTANDFHASVTGLGTFTMTYIYSDSNNCVDSTHANLTVYDIPVVGLSPFNPVCKGIPPFALTGGTPAGGTYSGVGVTNGVFNPMFASTYTITYTYQDATTTCSNDTVQLLIVMNKPIVTLPAINDICINSLPITLSGGDPAGGTYTGTGVNGVEFDPSVTGAGTFTVTYHFANIAGCEDSAHQTVTVRPLPIVNFAPEDGICVNGDTIVLSGGDPPGGIYTGLGVTNGIFNPDSTGVGQFSITYTFTDQYNCIDSASQTVTVFPLPNQFSISGGGIDCENIGSPVGLDGSQIGVEYTLLLNGSIQGFPYTGNGSAFSFGNQFYSGIFTIYAVNDSTGCVNTMLDSVEVTLIPLPNPKLGDSLYLCEVTEIVLDAGTYSDSLTYLWQDGSTDRFFTVTEPGEYWVSVGLGDCIAQDTIEVSNCSKMIVPNVFTPNSDEYNDRFKPKPIGDIVDYSIQIFNRWGKLVYESTDLEEGWDGTSFNKGAECAEGTYFFMIGFTSITYPQKKMDNKVTGSLSLLR